jgi:hypothetical protein
VYATVYSDARYGRHRRRSRHPLRVPRRFTVRGMPGTGNDFSGLDVLLNESVLLDAEWDHAKNTLALTFFVEMIPERGERSVDDLYVQVVLAHVRRIAASYRCGDDWEDPHASVEPLRIDGIGDALRSIRNHDALYGWRFFDVPDEEAFVDWADRLSLDHRTSADCDHCHTLTVWNEELLERDDCGRRMLELRAWFDRLSLRDRDGRAIPPDDAIGAARRYWERVLTRGSGGPSPYPVPRVVIPLRT